MDKKRDGIKEIDKVCVAVLELTDADFEQVKIMAEEQRSYVHPLKSATAQKFQELGDYNTRVINALYALREIIRGGADNADSI